MPPLSSTVIARARTIAGVRVQRADFAGTVRSVERTPQGGIRAPAALTRTGVLQYVDAQGVSRAELRHPDEVFAADSLATLRAATVTDLHPQEPVTAANYKTLGVGHVGDTISRERGDVDELVVADVVVQDAAEVALVESGERREVSCGYSCVVDPTPGTWNGQRYDAVQRAIRYNHVGLGPVGWGRAGSEVSLRMDGAAVQVRDAAPGKAGAMKLKIRGREYKLDAAEDVAGAQGAVDELAKKADADGAELGAVKSALMDALQKVAALEAKQAAAAAATPAPVTEEMVPEPVADSIASKRLALWSEAKAVLGADVKLDGKSREEIARDVAAKKKAVVQERFPTMKLDGLSADTIDGMFRASTDSSGRNEGLAAVHRTALGDPAGQRSDGGKADDPQNELRASTGERWKKPTSISAVGARA